MKTTFTLLIILSSSLWAFDHSHKSWDRITKKYVKKKANQTFFAYSSLQKNKNDRKKFENYLKELSKVTKKTFKNFSKEEQLSFLINAYNSFTVKLIIDNYPLKSIKDLGNIYSSPWKKKFFTFLGKSRHLDYIEHDLIRKIFNEPRVHYAVNCASIGCPNLQEKAFTPKNIEGLLSKAEKEFFKDPNKNRIQDNKIYISPIFKWFTEDFDKRYGSLRKYIATQLGKDKKEKESILQGYKIKWTHYDWKLNKL